MLPASLLLLAVVAGAQQATEISATVGFQGHVRVGAWAPVRVIVNNTRGTAAAGELFLPRQPANEDCEYRLPLELPPSSRRAFILYLRYESPASPVSVELRLRDGRRLAADLPCSPHGPDSRLVLAISRTAAGLSFIGAVPLPPRTSDDGLGGTPDSVVTYAAPDATTGALGLPGHLVGYSGLAAVVVRDISPASFQPDEQEALAGWVRSGGLLVIDAGPNAAELRDSFLEELSPVRLRGERTLPSLAALGTRFGTPAPEGAALVADSEAKPDAEVLAQQDGAPLLARRRVDNGVVYFCAADMIAPPLKDGDRLLLAMWGAMLSDATHAPQRAVRSHGRSARAEGLSGDTVRVPVLEWDAFAVFGGFLVVYIVFLVPVTRFVLRRADRREWTGWAMLLFIVLFSAGAFGLARWAPHASSRTDEGAMLRARSGSAVGWLDGIVGIRSPRETEYQVTCPGTGRTLEALVASRRLPPPPVNEAGGFSLTGVPVDLWGFAAFRVEGPLELGGPVTARLATARGGNLTVTVENGTSYPLKHTFLLTCTNVHPMEDLAPKRVAECAAIPRTELETGRLLPLASIKERLFQHCDAREDHASTPEQRIRRRLLAQLGESGESPHARPGVSPGMSGAPGAFSALLSEGGLLPSHPLFGAWVELPTPLVEVAPTSNARSSQLLLLVEVPLGPLADALAHVDFGPLHPDFTRDSELGLSADRQGKARIYFGSHQLDFQLPPLRGQRRATRLAVTLGCDQPGLSAAVRNLRTGHWDPLQVQPNHDVTTELQSPGDYVRWPEAHLTVRLSRAQKGTTPIHCSVSASGTLGP